MGKEYIASIHLEKISAIEVQYKSWPILAVLGGFLLVVGAFLITQNNNDSRDLGMAGLTVGALLILIYFFTRYHVISITSDGGTKINFQTKGMKREAVLDFVNKIENAKSLIK